MQLVTKKENAIANSIASGFYKNVERVGVEEAIKIAKKRAANFPNVKMVFEVNGQTFKIGKDTKPNKIVDRVKSEINELWSKHLEGKPEEIKKMAELFNLRTPEMKRGGRVGVAEGSTDFDKKVKEYQDMGMELKDAIDEAVKDFTKGRKDFKKNL